MSKIENLNPGVRKFIARCTAFQDMVERAKDQMHPPDPAYDPRSGVLVSPDIHCPILLKNQWCLASVRCEKETKTEKLRVDVFGAVNAACVERKIDL